MSAVRLEWRSLPYDPSKFLVVGTEIAAAYVPGTLSRFAVVETRGHPHDNYAGDVRYALRDAETVSDADVRAGRRPKMVGWFDTPDEAVEFALSSLENHDAP